MGKMKVVGAVALGILIGTMGVGAWNTVASAEPGTQNDPLVTLSYVEKRIQELNTSVSSRLDAQDEKLKTVPVSTDQAVFEIIHAKKGTMIYMGDSSELILRSGAASAIASSAGGLSNLTEGYDIAQGEPIPKNHFILVPRNDGRGIVVTADAYIMIRGGYTLIEP